METYFPASYEESRARFLRDAERIRPRWADSRLEARPLTRDPNLSIDWLWAHPRKKELVVVVSTAEHGIEGYVGAAILKLFMEEFAPRLNPENTGLLLVHAINPYGMKHKLRVNPNHVDLNRNFVYGETYDPTVNPDYDLLRDFLAPQKAAGGVKKGKAAFLLGAAKAILQFGATRIQTAALLGQRRHEQGLYFGGRAAQEETRAITSLYRRALSEYDSFVQMDMHTGYGPRYQMTMLLSPLEEISSAEATRKFNYPRVQKINADEFYAINGDMGDFVYRLRDAEFPGKRVFASGFEFGAFGDSFPALLRSLRITILENQLRHYGATDPQAEAEIRAEYEELFFPKEEAWRAKALQDARQALGGILAERLTSFS